MLLESAMLLEVLGVSLKITFLVAVLMVLIEWVQLRHEKGIEKFLTKSERNQIVGSSFLGALPGCIDAFLVVSLYSHRLVGFGALVAVMLATFGDEAFFVLTMAPQAALPLFGASIIFGIFGGFLAQRLSRNLPLEPKGCKIEIHKHEKNNGLLGKHFWKEHVWRHIIKKHLSRLFLWLFFSILVLQILTENLALESILPQNALLLMVLAAVVGLIPQSGPHIIFITLFSQGLIPFSVLLVSSLSQEGHGLLPLLSCSVRDAIILKAFKFVFALGVGLILLSVGL